MLSDNKPQPSVLSELMSWISPLFSAPAQQTQTCAGTVRLYKSDNSTIMLEFCHPQKSWLPKLILSKQDETTMALILTNHQSSKYLSIFDTVKAASNSLQFQEAPKTEKGPCTRNDYYKADDAVILQLVHTFCDELAKELPHCRLANDHVSKPQTPWEFVQEHVLEPMIPCSRQLTLSSPL